MARVYAVSSGDVIDNLTSTETAKPLSAKQGKTLQDTKINKTDIADNLVTDDSTKVLSAKQGMLLDANKINLSDIIDGLTSTSSTKVLSAKQGKVLNDSKVNISDIVDNLTSEDTDKPLSAKQGKVIQDSKVAKADIVDNLTTDDNTKVLSAKQGKVLNDDLTVLRWTATRPRYKDITGYFTDGTLWNRISGSGYAHPYYDIMPGDYLDMGRAVTCPGSYDGTVGSRWVTVASCGGLSGNGDSVDMLAPHLVMVPGQGAGGLFHFGRHAMNTTHVTTGGYAGSNMHTSILGAVASSGSTSGTVNQQLKYIFGAHLKTTRELLSNSINATGYNRYGLNSGCSNDWTWYDCQAVLMSEVEVYGSIVWSSSGYDTGNAKRQLELFAMDEAAINNRSAYYWLKDVVSVTYFARVGRYGYAYGDGAGTSDSSVRPRFVIQ